jgi:site-specific recombinase XerC
VSVKGDLPTGIVRTSRGYRVFQWVQWPGYERGRVRSKCFPADATIREMQGWQEDRRLEARARKNTTAPIVGEGFLADADRYLTAIVTMPTWKERKKHILEWVALFGERDRATITSTEIRAQRDRWLTVGPKRVYVKGQGWIAKPIPLSPHSVNLRLRALENLFTVLDGQDAPNPIDEVPEAEEASPAPKGQTFALAYEILSFMPDVTTPKKGGSVEKGSLSRIRFETMLMTGLTPRQLSALKPEHVNWLAGTLLAPKRLKGRRSRRQRAGRTRKARQLMPAAIPILKRFFAVHANAAFSASSLRQSVRRAIKAANQARAQRQLPPIPDGLTPYELTRHTFGTEVYRSTQNVLLVKDLLGHADSKQSERYAMAAIQEHQIAAVSELSKVAQRAKAGARRPDLTRARPSPSARARRVRTGRAVPR